MNGGRFEITRCCLLMIRHYSGCLRVGQKLHLRVSEFGRESERKKLRENVGKSKVMRCLIEAWK